MTFVSPPKETAQDRHREDDLRGAQKPARAGPFLTHFLHVLRSHCEKNAVFWKLLFWESVFRAFFGSIAPLSALWAELNSGYASNVSSNLQAVFWGWRFAPPKWQVLNLRKTEKMTKKWTGLCFAPRRDSTQKGRYCLEKRGGNGLVDTRKTFIPAEKLRLLQIIAPNVSKK